MTTKIGIIGSGNVGITTAFAIAEKGSGHIVLWGRTPGKAQGKALDLAEAGPIRRYDNRIQGTDDFDALMNADILVIAAGAPRKAGMSRFDLLDENHTFVLEMADQIKSKYKKSEPPIVIMLTEPVDVMTLAFQKRTGWPRERVLGIGGSLSASRLRHFLARKLGISPVDVDAMVVGTHGEKMVFLERYSRISGLPLSFFLSKEELDPLFEKTRNAGTEIVEQAKVGSSFYTPGAAVSEFVQAVATDSHRVLIASMVLDGEYGVSGRSVSIPVKVGSTGIERIFELDLNAEEKEQFKKSVEFQEAHASKVLASQEGRS